VSAVFNGTDAFNLCINQGATYERIFYWLNGQCGCTPAGQTTPPPVDLTGYTAQMQIKAFPLAPAVLYDASADLVLGGTAGSITLTISASDTETFTWWQGVYDLLLTSAGGQVTRLLSGLVTVSPAVTMP
jgi:hypothetical protein